MGSSVNLGVREVASICEQLQAAGAAIKLDAATDLLSNLQEEYNRARAALLAEVKGSWA